MGAPSYHACGSASGGRPYGVRSQPAEREFEPVPAPGY
jgi:hypothetical protein